MANRVHGRLYYALVEPLRSRIDAALTAMRVALDAEVFDEMFIAGQKIVFEQGFMNILTTAYYGVRAYQ